MKEACDLFYNNILGFLCGWKFSVFVESKSSFFEQIGTNHSKARLGTKEWAQVIQG